MWKHEKDKYFFIEENNPAFVGFLGGREIFFENKEIPTKTISDSEGIKEIYERDKKILILTIGKVDGEVVPIGNFD